MQILGFSPYAIGRSVGYIDLILKYPPSPVMSPGFYHCLTLYFHCSATLGEGKIMLKLREVLQRPPANLAKVVTRRILKEMAIKTEGKVRSRY